MVMGEPRIGRSRLLTVLAKSFAGQTNPVLLQLQPVHSAVPFAAAHFIAKQVSRKTFRICKNLTENLTRKMEAVR